MHREQRCADVLARNRRVKSNNQSDERTTADGDGRTKASRLKNTYDYQSQLLLKIHPNLRSIWNKEAEEWWDRDIFVSTLRQICRPLGCRILPSHLFTQIERGPSRLIGRYYSEIRDWKIESWGEKKWLFNSCTGIDVYWPQTFWKALWREWSKEASIKEPKSTKSKSSENSFGEAWSKDVCLLTRVLMILDIVEDQSK